jgi:hypothetical protein
MCNQECVEELSNNMNRGVTMSYPRHDEYSVKVNASTGEVFHYLDDHMNLSSHMAKSSFMMAGSTMILQTDAQEGRKLGSVIVMRGKMLGLPLFVNQVVTERHPPLRKAWQTVGPQRLFVLDQYEMGFELRRFKGMTVVRVFIDYSLPEKGAGKWLGELFGSMYARWCTKQIAHVALKHFSSASPFKRPGAAAKHLASRM